MTIDSTGLIFMVLYLAKSQNNHKRGKMKQNPKLLKFWDTLILYILHRGAGGGKDA